MKRFHALEWEDLQWFPKSWRDYGTDYLQFVATKFDIYKVIEPIIKRGIATSGNSTWVDCASGGGGGLLNLAKNLNQEIPDLKIVLTDYYPNVKAFESTKSKFPEIFQFEPNSVNALAIPEKYHGKFRTIFGAFHHFRPNDAKQILQNAIDTNSPIAVFEPIDRNFGSFFSMLFVILNVLLFTPFIRPVRWEVLPFIYLIPIIPLYIMWDGIASILRTYSEDELKEIVKSLHNTDTYHWEIGSIKNGPMPINYLYGHKKV